MNRFACIYIGPNQIDLVIAQRGASRKVKVLDHACYFIDFDYEIYQKGRISNKSALTLERVIVEYNRLAQENLPDQTDIIFSKELKEAENFLFIYFRIQALVENCNLRILSEDKELELFCSTAKLLLSDVENIETADMLLAEMNSQSINFALTNNGIIDYTERIPYGYVKLVDLVELIMSQRTHYSKLLGEIIANKLRLAVGHINGRELKLVSLITKDASILNEIFNGEKKGDLFVFTKDEIDSAYRKTKELTPEQLRTLYPQLTESQSMTIQSTLIVARQLIQTAKKDKIYLIQRNLAETLVQLEFKITKRREIKQWLEEGTYQSAIALADRYNVDQKHADVVEQYSERIFDTLKKNHVLPKRSKRFLRIACRLFDVGQYGGEEGQAQAVEDIILREDLIGLSKENRRIVARICKNTKLNSFDKTLENDGFKMSDALIIAQCTAIMKIASALDQSRRKKISKIQCSLNENQLIIKITTSHNTQLESYYFNRDSLWVERIFNLEPVLKVKRIKVQAE